MPGTNSSTLAPPTPCYACGLDAPEIICTLPSPLDPSTFHYFPGSLGLAMRVIEDGETKLAAIDEAIQQLQRRRSHIHRIVTHHRNYVAPISRLTNDILLLVFECLVWAKEDVFSEEVWSLAAVCARWRTLAISCSGLWARVDLVLTLEEEETTPSEYHDGFPSATEVATSRALLRSHRALILLERAKDKPLVCYIDLHEDMQETYGHSKYSAFIDDTVKYILAQHHRINSITAREVHLDSEESPTFALLCALDYTAPTIPDAFLDINRYFHGTPLLQHLSLTGIGDVEIASAFPTAWKNVTALKLRRSCFTESQLIDILCVMTGLAKLSMGGIDFPHNARPSSAIMKVAVLLHLKELEVDLSPSAYMWEGTAGSRTLMPTVIKLIRCPNLMTLRIIAPTEHILDIQAFQECILSSGNPSSVLSIIFDLATLDHADSIISLISNLPSLKSIRVKGLTEDHLDCNSILEALRWED